MLVDQRRNLGNTAVKAEIFAVFFQIMHRAEQIIVARKVDLGIHIDLQTAENIELIFIFFFQKSNFFFVCLRTFDGHGMARGIVHIGMTRKADGIKALFDCRKEHFLERILAVAIGAVRM